jgi:hypothetical protein
MPSFPRREPEEMPPAVVTVSSSAGNDAEIRPDRY